MLPHNEVRQCIDVDWTDTRSLPAWKCGQSTTEKRLRATVKFDGNRRESIYVLQRAKDKIWDLSKYMAPKWYTHIECQDVRQITKCHDSIGDWIPRIWVPWLLGILKALILTQSSLHLIWESKQSTARVEGDSYPHHLLARLKIKNCERLCACPLSSFSNSWGH